MSVCATPAPSSNKRKLCQRRRRQQRGQLDVSPTSIDAGSDLPTELVKLIIELLLHADIELGHDLRCVCRAWHTIVDELRPRVWQYERRRPDNRPEMRTHDMDAKEKNVHGPTWSAEPTVTKTSTVMMLFVMGMSGGNHVVGTDLRSEWRHVAKSSAWRKIFEDAEDPLWRSCAYVRSTHVSDAALTEALVDGAPCTSTGSAERLARFCMAKPLEPAEVASGRINKMRGRIYEWLVKAVFSSARRDATRIVALRCGGHYDDYLRPRLAAAIAVTTCVRIAHALIDEVAELAAATRPDTTRWRTIAQEVAVLRNTTEDACVALALEYDVRGRPCIRRMTVPCEWGKCVERAACEEGTWNRARKYMARAREPPFVELFAAVTELTRRSSTLAECALEWAVRGPHVDAVKPPPVFRGLLVYWRRPWLIVGRTVTGNAKTPHIAPLSSALVWKQLLKCRDARGSNASMAAVMHAGIADTECCLLCEPRPLDQWAALVVRDDADALRIYLSAQRAFVDDIVRSGYELWLRYCLLVCAPRCFDVLRAAVEVAPSSLAVLAPNGDYGDGMPYRVDRVRFARMLLPCATVIAKPAVEMDCLMWSALYAASVILYGHADMTRAGVDSGPSLYLMRAEMQRRWHTTLVRWQSVVDEIASWRIDDALLKKDMNVNDYLKDATAIRVPCDKKTNGDNDNKDDVVVLNAAECGTPTWSTCANCRRNHNQDFRADCSTRRLLSRAQRTSLAAGDVVDEMNRIFGYDERYSLDMSSPEFRLLEWRAKDAHDVVLATPAPRAGGDGKSEETENAAPT